MSDSRWSVMLIAGLLLVIVLVMWIRHGADNMEKQMCLDAGMRWEQTTEGIECK